MSTLVYTLLEGARYGWTSAITVGLFAAAAVLLGAFAVIESRAAAPLIPRGFLHRRATLVPTTVQWLLTLSAFSSFFMLTLYLQQVLRYTPLQAGLGYIPLAAAVVGASVIASKLIPRFGSRLIVVTGLATVGAGLALLGHAPAGATYTANILPGLVLIGFGAGFSFVAITTAGSPRSKKMPPGSPPGCSAAPRNSAAPSAWPSSSPQPPPAPALCLAPAQPQAPPKPAADALAGLESSSSGGSTGGDRS